MPDLMTSVDSAQATSEGARTLDLCFLPFALFCILLSLAGISGREVFCSFHSILVSLLP